MSESRLFPVRAKRACAILGAALVSGVAGSVRGQDGWRIVDSHGCESDTIHNGALKLVTE